MYVFFFNRPMPPKKPKSELRIDRIKVLEEAEHPDVQEAAAQEHPAVQVQHSLQEAVQEYQVQNYTYEDLFRQLEEALNQQKS